MANTPDFVTHALELLSGVGPVEARAMFGGHGLYAQGVMFGLLDDDELFLKADDVSRPRFLDAGCRQWVYVSKTQRMESTGYYRPPDEAHEEPEAMLAWATLGLDSALRARAAKGTRGSARKRKATPRATPARAAKATPGRRGTAARPRAKASRRRAKPR